MTDKAYTVELSNNGREWKDVVYAATPARARKEARNDNPNAMIWEVDTL